MLAGMQTIARVHAARCERVCACEACCKGLGKLPGHGLGYEQTGRGQQDVREQGVRACSGATGKDIGDAKWTRLRVHAQVRRAKARTRARARCHGRT